MPYPLPLATMLCLGMLAMPQLGWAQQSAVAAPNPAGYSYLGLGGAVGYYAQGIPGAINVLAPTFVAGRRVTRRWSLELGVLVYYTRDDRRSQGIYIDTTGGSSTLKGAVFRSVHQQRTQAVSLAARYALVPQLSRRLSFDAVLGLALVHTDEIGFNVTLDQASGQPVSGNYYAQFDRITGCLLLGPSLRYQASPHLDVVGEVVGNFAASGQNVSWNRTALTIGLSVRYRFGASAGGQP